MQSFVIADAADQRFDIIVSGQRVSIRLRWNETSQAWSMGLSISTVPKIEGRKIVGGVNLLAAFNLGIGGIFADGDGPPSYDQLVTGARKIYHATDEELAAARAQ